MPVKSTTKTNLSSKSGVRVKGSAQKTSPRRKEAPSDKCFWINHGPIVKNLKELAGALRTMSDEQFDYHTKRAGNDFAKWVSEVLGERACATMLARSKTRSSAMKALEKHLP